MGDQNAYEGWAIVELFGHSMLAGHIGEAIIAGGSYLRVDVPGANGRPGFSKFLGHGAVFGITPSDELTVKMAAERLRAAPVQLYLLAEPEPDGY